MAIKLFETFGLSETRKHEIKKFIIIFYIVGLAGLLVPATTEFFKLITPLALILNFVILTAYHRGDFSRKLIFVFLGIYIFGFLIEVIGVKSSLIFGEYTYGVTLGPKVFDTPLIIGLNWLFLCYVSNSVLEKYNIHISLKIIGASLLMLIYDIVLEQVAPLLDFWYWGDNAVPLQNYAAWFVIALVFNSAVKLLKISTKNAMSKIVFITQFLFFLLLYVFYTWI